MQEMQRLAPELSALKEKYKDDKQRQQQEMMKFYQERGINPLASCLPLLLQLPVFISLFYMLRTDLKKHICGPQLVSYYNAPNGTHLATTYKSASTSRRSPSCHRNTSKTRPATRSPRTPASSCSSPISPARRPAWSSSS